MESLSSYARQFLGQMEKPDVESIEGLSPAISIDQKSTNRNPRSTVGTVTEIYDYFRLLYARIGIPHCPKCGREIHKQTCGSDGGSDHGAAGEDEDPAAGTGGPRPEGRACESCWSKPERAAMSVCRSMEICMSCPRRSSWRKITSITLRSWWIVW